VKARVLGAALAVVICLTVVLGTGTRAAHADDDLPAVRRVLVIALPGVTWRDVMTHDVPTLRHLLETSAVANLASRVQRIKSGVNDGYATIGSGTRAIARKTDAGLAFEPAEKVEADTAGDAYIRHQGHPATGAIVHLRVSSIKSANKHSLFGATVSMLGDALERTGVQRGVVANSDVVPLDPDMSSYHREAALALMGSDGQVPCGAVGDELLQRDPTAAWGVNLDLTKTVNAAARCFTDRSVVLVEASDLPRTELYAPSVSRPRFETLWGQALERSDRLVARLLGLVNPARDAVVVVAPSSPQIGLAHLTVFGVRAPGLSAGLLDSGVTRQTGFVSIVDVAPTLASLMRAPLKQGDIEGRPVSVASRGGNAGRRLDRLVNADADARFRDRNITPFTLIVTISALVLSLVTVVLLRFGFRTRVLEWAALALLVTFPLTYWAALLPFRDWGEGPFYLFVLGGAAVIGLLLLLARRAALVPLVLALALMPLTTAISVVLLDSRLQLSTVLGDSPIVAGRFSGVNNVTFAQLMVAAIAIGAVIVSTRRRDVALWGVGALFIAVLLLDGAPMWGADVGGILAGVPALGLAFVLFAGWKVRVRTVVTVLVATVAVVGVAGLIDMTRSTSHQTHLGRLFESIAGKGSSGFTTVVGRKLHVQIQTLTTSIWRFMIIPTAVLSAYVVWSAPRRLRAVQHRMPAAAAALIAIAVAGVLGYALNDSGIAVPGAMLVIVAPAAIYLLMRVDEPAEVS
jgi:hypothetical protein